MSQTVAGILVDVLDKIGVTHIFGLIADSLNPIGDAVRHSQIEWIGVRHEEGAALAAAGQAKLTGRLGVCCGTTGPGSNHLVAMMRGHYAYYGITGNSRRLSWYAYQVARIWQKWLSRRDRGSRLHWRRFTALLKRCPLPAPRIVHRYTTTSEALP